ncbi:hypothetical protein IscW_ISCW001919 [Ixodes scapularis]|uniref:Uncharacterized protein n=1 Tax=Ixodes scapularis TaxID=6945 RepID=B7PAU8_IXOSC|nr:hypothetical protein IscW_ISCW001919 [Ixodes scapularis]|eukprot:XP_002407276.1 hypothetical protein IscW_ISCW001919 [Ixodes scapularis]
MQRPQPDDIRGAYFDVAGGDRDAVLRRYWEISLYVARVMVLAGVDGQPTLAQHRAIRRKAASIYLNIRLLPTTASGG